MVEDVTTDLPVIRGVMTVQRRRSQFGNSLCGYISPAVPHPPIGLGSSQLSGNQSDVVHEIDDLPREPQYRSGNVNQVEQQGR